jgi:phosphotransferase system HPr (HPr) family protein
MSVMQLAAANGEEITVKAVGPDADEAVKSISYLVKSKFFEE